MSLKTVNITEEGGGVRSAPRRANVAATLPTAKNKKIDPNSPSDIYASLSEARIKDFHTNKIILVVEDNLISGSKLLAKLQQMFLLKSLIIHQLKEWS